MKVHMSLPVKNIKATTDFYRILLANEPSKVKSDYAKFEPIDLALNISFHQVKADKQLYTDQHLGIQFSSLEKLAAAYDRLEKANLIQKQRQTSVCCYANQDKFLTQDPDGYQWELYYLVEDSDLKMAPDTQCCSA